MIVFRRILTILLAPVVLIYAVGTLAGVNNSGGNDIDYFLRIAYAALLIFGVYKLWPKTKPSSSEQVAGNTSSEAGEAAQSFHNGDDGSQDELPPPENRGRHSAE
jgi:hypothetical protein